MCDTLVLRANGITWFAKNSDREPDEPQALVRHERADSDTAATVRATYIDIPQVPKRHAMLLSQPNWMWGAEIGVNEHGVAIGNEAVFSRLIDKRGRALLGMDLLRLGLERGASARKALDTITDHLERFGQAGPAGYRDTGFRYDNAFLIANPHEAWVLETAGRLWAAKRVERWAISNCYSIGADYDLCSDKLPEQARRLNCWNGRGEFHFARAFDTRLYAFIGGAHRRRALNTEALECGLTPSWATLAARLRDHGRHSDDFAHHDNRQICLHSCNALRPSQTTASLIARLTPQSVQLAATGTSAPCLSLFEPMEFRHLAASSLPVEPGATVSDTRWAQFEPVHQRALFDPEFLQALRQDRDEIEAQCLAVAESDAPDWNEAARLAADWHRRWHGNAVDTAMAPLLKGSYGRWWATRSMRETADLNKHFFH